MFLVLLTICLGADTLEVTRTTVSGQETIYAQYVQGKNVRTEDLRPDGVRPAVTIWNSDQKTLYQLDPQSQEYIQVGPRQAGWILSLAQWIARPARIQQSGKTVNIYYETIDTGERREFFGRTAKHLVLRERHVAEPGACDHTHQTEKDGWYIPRREAGAATGTYRLVSYIGSINGGICRDTVVNHGALSLPGIPVRESDGLMTREILEMSDEPLDKSLFEVPSGFKKVEALPGQPSMTWSERLAMEWRALEQAVESRFD